MNEKQQMELCQNCARCCKEFRLYTTDMDEAARWRWLDTQEIEVKQLKPDTNWVEEKKELIIYLIRIKIPCQELDYKYGKYWCRKYHSIRPNYCVTYPKNFLNAYMENDIPQVQLEEEMRFCPLLRELVREKREVKA